MIQKHIKKVIKKEKFHPGVIGIFINYNFLIRRALCSVIKNNAHQFNGSLLDFGCGTKPYKNYFTNVTEYLGVDYKIEGREEIYNEVDFFYNGKSIPFEDNRFDSILCTEVLEHVFNIEEVLSEFNRVLKNNGRAIITTPFMWEEHEMPYDFARYTTPALIHLYQKSGFKVVENFKTGNAIEVILQFSLNYIKNILPNNLLIKQIVLISITFIFNLTGLFLSFIFPVDKKIYFNNIFVLEKIV